MPNILTIFNKNTHTWEKCNWNRWKETFSRYLHWHIMVFHSKKFKEKNPDFLQRMIMANVYIFSLFGRHSVFVAQFCILIIRVPSSFVHRKIPIDFFILIFSRVFKPDKLNRGGILKGTSCYFSYYWMSILRIQRY